MQAVFKVGGSVVSSAVAWSRFLLAQSSGGHMVAYLYDVQTKQVF